MGRDPNILPGEPPDDSGDENSSHELGGAIQSNKPDPNAPTEPVKPTPVGKDDDSPDGEEG